MDTFTYAAVLFSAVFHATWNFYAKKSPANKVVLIWSSQLFVGLLLFPLSLYLIYQEGLSVEACYFIVLSSIVHALYVLLLGSAYELGEISTVYPIARGAGIAGTAVVATLIAIDELTLIGVIGIASTLFGVLTIGLAKRGLKNARRILGVSLLVGLSISGYSVIDKMAVSFVSPMIFVVIVHLGSSFVLSYWIFTKLREEAREVFARHKRYSTYIGIVSLATYALILWAFTSSPASYVVALRETSILFATILGVVVLKEKLTFLKGLGIFLILAGAVLVKFA